MPLKTSEEYAQSLRDLGHRVFIQGAIPDCIVDHPISRPPAMALAETYKYQDVVPIHRKIAKRSINIQSR